MAYEYDPSLEWPGDDEFTIAQNQSVEPSRPILRLVVLKSNVIPPKRTLVIIDNLDEISIGRDTLPGAPRLRLKAMEVSKYHATIFWNDVWNIVDVGSVHGTFLLAKEVVEDSSAVPVRLSQPRTASQPRSLQHGDVIVIGSTKLQCHIHSNPSYPCASCSLTEVNEISLFETSKAAPSSISSTSTASITEKDIPPRKALANLKASMLARTKRASPALESNSKYIDRAARRRDTVGSSFPSSASNTASYSHSSTNTPPPLVSQTRSPSPPRSIAAENIGHKLLLKQGWTPGKGLGAAEDGREEILSTTLLVPRAGLGASKPMRSVDDGAIDWKDAGRRRRWEAEHPS